MRLDFDVRSLYLKKCPSKNPSATLTGSGFGTHENLQLVRLQTAPTKKGDIWKKPTALSSQLSPVSFGYRYVRLPHRLQKTLVLPDG